MSNGSIGIFDSGFGGLSIWRHVANDIPNKKMIYLADSGYCPYGTRSYEDIQERVRSIVDFFIDQFSVKIVVVACNTATAAAIDFLRNHYSIPFVGMEPAIKPAALQTKSKVVGVLATEGTFNGRLFRQTSERYTNGIKMLIQPGHGLVEFIEQGIIAGPEIESLLVKYISPMVAQGADSLVLGCTHYPFLSSTIEKLFPRLNLIDPAPAVSIRTRNLLAEWNLEPKIADGRTQFLTTGNDLLLDEFVLKNLGKKIKSRRIEL